MIANAKRRYGWTVCLWGAVLLGGVGVPGESARAVSGQEVPVPAIHGVSSEIRTPRARWEGTELVIQGKIRRLFPSLVRGHVDVVLCTERGTVLRMVEASPFPRARAGRGQRERSFSVGLARLEEVPEEVRLAWHGPVSLHDAEVACRPAADRALRRGP